MIDGGSIEKIKYKSKHERGSRLAQTGCQLTGLIKRFLFIERD